MELSWAEDLSVGNAMIDSEHKMLLGMVNEVVRAIEMGECSALAQAFDLLDDRLRTHFANEANIARAAKFSFEHHKLAQQYFLAELVFLKDELTARNFVGCEDAIKHYSNSLKGMFVNHIAKKDMQMKPVLESYPYDFNPACS